MFIELYSRIHLLSILIIWNLENLPCPPAAPFRSLQKFQEKKIKTLFIKYKAFVIDNIKYWMVNTVNLNKMAHFTEETKPIT